MKRKLTMAAKSPARAVEAPAATTSGEKTNTKRLPIKPDKRERAKKAFDPNRSSAILPIK